MNFGVDFFGQIQFAVTVYSLSKYLIAFQLLSLKKMLLLFYYFNIFLFLSFHLSINPITGVVEEEQPNPMEGMTEEQKEYEAMKLLDMFDKLSRYIKAGILQHASNKHAHSHTNRQTQKKYTCTGQFVINCTFCWHFNSFQNFYV